VRGAAGNSRPYRDTQFKQNSSTKSPDPFFRHESGKKPTKLSVSSTWADRTLTIIAGKPLFCYPDSARPQIEAAERRLHPPETRACPHAKHSVSSSVCRQHRASRRNLDACGDRDCDSGERYPGQGKPSPTNQFPENLGKSTSLAAYLLWSQPSISPAMTRKSPIQWVVRFIYLTGRCPFTLFVKFVGLDVAVVQYSVCF